MKYLYIILITLVVNTVQAQHTGKFYYLCIGNEHYKQHKSDFFDKDFSPYDDLPAATNSALLMQDVCKNYLHASGKTILSTDGHRIQKKEIFASLDELEKQIKKDGTANPCVIFYYCGHGISENAAWSQIMVMGDFSVSGTRHLTLEENNREFSGNIIILDEIVEYFKEKEYRYIILLDCCRTSISEEDAFAKIYNMVKMPTDMESVIKLAPADADDEDMEDIQEAMKEYNEIMRQSMKDWKVSNEYHQADAVIYSSPASKITLPVFAPNTQNIKLEHLKPVQSSEVLDEQKVGPICRRTISVIDQFYQSAAKKSLTLAGFVNDMTNPALDPQTPTPTTNFTDKDEPAEKHIVLIKK